MVARYFTLTAGLLALSVATLPAQEDAQDRTQAFFDNHKSADVINPERALTEKPKPTPEIVRESTLPPLTGINPKEQREKRKLEQKKAAFVDLAVKEEKKSKAKMAGARATEISESRMKILAAKEWDETDPAAPRLKALERKAQQGKKSDSALPKFTY
jgi:hypothetical protein